MNERTIHTGQEFRELIRRVRAGDDQAAAELVHVYEPHVRRAVRIRLGVARLRRVVDSMDISQSVLGTFFIRAAAGQFQLDTPRQLVSLLARMAENRVRDWQRRYSALRRDKRREVSLSRLAHEPMARTLTLTQERDSAETLEEVLLRLSPDDRELVERRRAGDSWATIAEDIHKTPDALRMQLRRAVDRALQELELDD
jgi:RNA polymerase sigma-70 factor (ECF subfamily)